MRDMTRSSMVSGRRHAAAPAARRATTAALLVVLLAGGVFAQPPTLPAARGATSATADDEGERHFVEALRHEDPASAERYVALRDARQRATAELQQVYDRLNAAGPALRSVFVPQLGPAQRKYAEASLALLDFLEERDRRAIVTFQEQIAKITQVLEERKKTRAELESLLKGQ